MEKQELDRIYWKYFSPEKSPHYGMRTVNGWYIPKHPPKRRQSLVWDSRRNHISRAERRKKGLMHGHGETYVRATCKNLKTWENLR